MNKFRRYWLVVRDTEIDGSYYQGSSGSYPRFFTKDDAINESCRLAEKFPGNTYVVLEAVHAVVSSKVQVMEPAEYPF